MIKNDSTFLGEASFGKEGSVGSNPTPLIFIEPLELVNFGLWLRKRGNRDSAVIRKLKFLKGLSGSVDNMVESVLKCGWSDNSKALALLTVRQ